MIGSATPNSLTRFLSVVIFCFNALSFAAAFALEEISRPSSNACSLPSAIIKSGKSLFISFFASFLSSSVLKLTTRISSSLRIFL